MFEVHITINSILNSDLDQFKLFCQKIEAKPILIELPQGEVTQQAMISKVYGSTTIDIKKEIENLEIEFSKSNYEIIRTKVEVPLDFINKGRAAFPNYHGQYYEWHGKVEFDDMETLKKSLKSYDAHLSNSSLKNQLNRRFVTIRGYHNERFFLNKVDVVKKALKRNNIKMIKDEYEYCIYDSNKTVDNGWINIPEITNERYLNLLAFEGFIKRSVELNEKFILKGSLITRQYFKDKEWREVLDLDYVYGEFIEEDTIARDTFSSWVTKVTEKEVDDNITYQSFKENDFWRGIDYAMNDDFPTTNTDLTCTIDNYEIPVVSLDISWNLPLEQEAIPLKYITVNGEEILIPYTVPLETQIAWKLHQSIVRPRAKDFIDIMLLLESNILSTEQIKLIAAIYSNECIKDKISPQRIYRYIDGEVSDFLKKNRNQLDESFNGYWLLETPFGFDITTAMKLAYLDDIFRIDFEFKDVQGLTQSFEQYLKRSGIGKEIPSKREKVEKATNNIDSPSKNSNIKAENKKLSFLERLNRYIKNIRQ